MYQLIVNKNSSGDETANVNFFYDDTLCALQNIVRCCIFNMTQTAGRLGSGVPRVGEAAWYYCTPLQPCPYLL